MNYKNISMLALALCLPGTALAVDTEALTAECESCHGPGGVSSQSDVPSISGQSKDYLDDSLHAYQVWGRPCVKTLYRHGDTSRPKTDMCKIASGLSDQDIEVLSSLYGEKPFVAAKQDFDPEKAAAGAALHEKNCESCHSNGGSPTGRGPRLAGQWTPYLKATLKYVPTGEHLVPPMMERKIGDFSDEELNALMDFYASQQE